MIGRIVFEGSPEDVHWGMSQATLQVEGAKAPQLDYDRDPAGSARAQSLHQALTLFAFALSKDGIIRSDDVPPGTYTLSIQLESANADPQVVSKPPFGSLKKQVIVPPADDATVPVNLGELTIERAK